jgi:hypothetical protein
MSSLSSDVPVLVRSTVATAVSSGGRRASTATTAVLSQYLENAVAKASFDTWRERLAQLVFGLFVSGLLALLFVLYTGLWVV